MCYRMEYNVELKLSTVPNLDGGHPLVVDLIDIVNSIRAADQRLVVYVGGVK